MSVNQSRGDKNEPPHYRRVGRSSNSSLQKNYSGGGGKGGGGGGGNTTAPPSSGSFSSNRSFKKVGNHAQGVQPRAGNPNTNSINSSTAGGTVIPNGSHLQPMVRGASGGAPVTGSDLKPSDVSTQKSPGLPRAPQGNAAGSGSDATGPSTPPKGPADASKTFSLQFGSISPGLMNGMQIPARTTSAPPNMDEQKQAQAHLESMKAVKVPTPAIPKQPIPKKDVVQVDQSNVTDIHPIPKPKKDIQMIPSTPPTQSQKQLSGPPIPGVSVQVPFHHSQIHVPYGGPNPQMQSQGMVNSSMPMPLPMPLPMGSPPQVQQPVFVTGIQHHPMPPQGIIHQGQGLNFSSQMGPPQMPPQLGNMGIGLGQHFQPQQAGKLGAHRKTVKITHPETHEELRLDKRADGFVDSGPKRSGPRPHPHQMPQSQPIQSFPPGHPMSFYPNSYNPNPGPLFFQGPASNPQTTPASQPPRFYNQVTVKPAANAHEKIGDSSFLGSTTAIEKNELSKTRRAHGEAASDHPTETSTGISPKNATFGSFQSENLTNSLSSSSPATVEDRVPLEVSKKVTVNKSGSFKEEQMKPVKNVQSVPVDQVGGQSASSQSPKHQASVDSGVSEILKPSIPSTELKEEVVETSKKDEGLKPIETIGTDTNPESSLKIQEPKAESVEKREKVLTSEPEKHDAGNNKSLKSASAENIDVLSAETSSLNLGSSQVDDISSSDVSLSKAAENVGNKESVPADVSVSVPNKPAECEDKTLSDANKTKVNTSKPKKKFRDILKFADAQGTTSDLYMAYKGPEEKKEVPSVETVEPPKVDMSKKDVPSDEKQGQNKFEPEDWEDAADISTPKLETSVNGKSDGLAKKYSRDFLLKFAEQCTELPHDFERTMDIAEAVANVNASREPYPSPGRADRSAARLDRRPSNVGHDDRRNKQMGQGRDMRLDVGYAANAAGFRPVHGGVLRNQRGQPPVQYAGGILSGPIPSPGGHGVMQRNNSDSDRWQRVAGCQKGLIPSPHTPMPMMHKAEQKYEVGKVTDEEQAKQRQLKCILNKLTPQNFEKLFEQVKQVNIDNATTLSGVINQIFDKALMEPTFCEMYANFCSRLAVELPDFSENNEKITFKRLLLNKCQEEFERGEREEQEANRTDEEGEVKQSEEEREEKRIKARRRMLGNIRLIGELYKKKMLTERIMHECIKKLLGSYDQNPDEEDIESLCKLMSTIGGIIDHPRAKEHLDAYFDTMAKLSNNTNLSSRVRFMLKDVIDLRKNKWQQRRKVEGPKKIEEVHRDAAQERQAQTSRLARGPSFNSSIRRAQPMDFGPRGSNVLPSPNAQMGGFRGMPSPQVRGYNQDARFDDRHTFENRTIPLRPIGDDSITLGPQGGLARGMSIRGPPNMPLNEISGPTDSRRVTAGPNGYGSLSERTNYGPREDFPPRYIPERSAPSPIEHNFDRSTQVWVATPSQNVSTDNKVWPEDRLRDMSLEAIKEFYSARDEKEAALCVKELNAPGFYPTMISIWVSDSFERKDMDRDSLAKLLVSLVKSHDGILSQDSLVRGLESVLGALEDSVNDAPKAAEYLGRIVGKLLMENIIPYKETWRLIYEGGEERGRLVEVGLAAEVLGVILEMIEAEKGEAFLKQMCGGTDLRVSEFRPPNSRKALRLDKFI